MRAFVSLEIPDKGVLDSLVSFQGELAATGADLKIVERQNLHYTLKFLGDISEAQVGEADRRLRSLRLGGTTVSVAGVGAFPSPQRPNVIWVGVGPGDEVKVRPIAETVIRTMEGIGERDSRPFQAHVTLARARAGGSRGELTALIWAKAQMSFGVTPLTSFRLKSSQLTPRGPVYDDVGVYTLS